MSARVSGSRCVLCGQKSLNTKFTELLRALRVKSAKGTEDTENLFGCGRQPRCEIRTILRILY